MENKFSNGRGKLKKTFLLSTITLLVLTSFVLVAQVPGIGGRVVYVSDRSGSENLWVLDMQTQKNRKISAFPGEWGITSLEQPQWSQDGKVILFAGWTGNWNLFVMNADGTNIRKLTSGMRVEYFRWDTIDQNRVYYNCANYQFHRLNISTNLDEAIPNPLGSSGPTTFDITSDGSEIMFTRDSIYGYQNMVEPVSQRIIKPYEGRRSYATRINRVDGWICYWESRTDPCTSWDTDIWKISPDGTTRVQLTHVVPGAEYNLYPSWGNGPNDGYIFFGGNHFGNLEVCIMKADGISYPDGIINLTNNPASDREPDWTATVWNQAPTARCKDIKLCANADCQALIVAEDINDGSDDPDGDEITLAISPAGPLTVGEHFVTLTVTDEHGASDSCVADILVADSATPLISLSDPVCVHVGNGNGNMANSLTVSAVDGCSGITELRIDQVEVFNKGGNPVQGNGVFEVSGNDIYIFPSGTGWSVCVTATATDGAGNSDTVRICKSLQKCKK